MPEIQDILVCLSVKFSLSDIWQSPSPTPSPSGTQHESNNSRMQLLLPSYPSVENQGHSSLDNLPGQSAHQETPQSPQDPISRTSQGPLLFNSGPSPNESAQPVPLHFHPPMNTLTHNPADTPSTTSTSLHLPPLLMHPLLATHPQDCQLFKQSKTT